MRPQAESIETILAQFSISVPPENFRKPKKQISQLELFECDWPFCGVGS